MKQILLIVALTMLTGCFSYFYPKSRFIIPKHLKIENKTGKDIFDLTEMWVAWQFVDSRSVMEVNNRHGQMMYANVILFAKEYRNTHKFTADIEIFIRDNQIQLNWTNIEFLGNLKKEKGITYFEDPALDKDIRAAVIDEIDALTVNLERYIKTPKWKD